MKRSAAPTKKGIAGKILTNILVPLMAVDVCAASLFGT
jgi:hypothetical protein